MLIWFHLPPPKKKKKLTVEFGVRSKNQDLQEYSKAVVNKASARQQLTVRDKWDVWQMCRSYEGNGCKQWDTTFHVSSRGTEVTSVTDVTLTTWAAKPDLAWAAHTKVFGTLWPQKTWLLLLGLIVTSPHLWETPGCSGAELGFSVLSKQLPYSNIHFLKSDFI